MNDPLVSAVLGLAVAAVLSLTVLGAWRLANPVARRAPVPPPAGPRKPGDEPRGLLESCMSEAALWFDADGTLIRASASVAAVLGVDADALISRPPVADDLLGIGGILPTLARLEPGQEATIRVRRPDQDLVMLHARSHDASTDPEFGFDRLVMLRDVTRQHLTENRLDAALERLARLTNEDPLTGLVNRAWFLDSAERMMGGVEPLAMMLIDLDRFAPINDVHGPHVGDLILRETATRLSRELTEAPLIARLGADEYAVLLPASDGDDAVATRARDVIRAISEPIEVGPMTLDVSATIGIAVSPRDGMRAATLLRYAGIAMAQARLVGGACYRFFERRMSDDLAMAEDLKADLRAAIVAGEIKPYFQPIVRLSDSSVIGFEVLARWDHPERGVLSPMVFLPLVEELGQSAAMLASILSQACAAALDWPAGIRLSVNVSPSELQDESLPEDVAAILRTVGMDGARVEIEVTENALIHDSRIARGVIDRLRAMGMSMALDDFGTGFSSLYHLKELPFDKVKIDKSFIQSLSTDAESARYVSAIIGLGHALDLELTAEGIEDQATMALLRDLGCTYGQGYLFGRPMPAADANAMLRTGLPATTAAA